jgi:carbamate kinase
VARTAVVALGGNALLAQGEKGTYEQQRTNAAAMAVSICALLEAGWRVVVVHGNGPQVGNLAIQQELGRGEVPAMPLFSLGAMTEGQLGSLIAIALYGVCGRRHRIAALLSHVIVDLDDPAFERPTKPIGPFFSEEAATRLAETRGWDITEDAGRGFRRVVASPLPRGFVEIEAISSLLDAGHVVVTGGGGGIPVGRRGDVWDGVDAVIDNGLRRCRTRPPAPGRGARPHHRGRRRPARLRQEDPASADLDRLRGSEETPQEGAVPGREHGTQGERSRPVRRGR